ncbi:hypothetical protein [Photobacterium alginatilyticum]|nr:hypothetical protein [Photobacterium alginatilyticum]
MSLIIGVVFSLGYYTYHVRQSNSLLQNRFNQVIGLRQLIHLLRFHRRQTHQLLSSSGTFLGKEQPLNESLAIQSLLRTLISQAEHSQKPMYRILMKRITSLLDEWPRYSLQRNQAVHGKAIRHVLYLIDDTITQSLLAADKEHVFQQYQSTWPVTLNAIDSLSRFRHTIHSYHPNSTAIKRELGLHTQILRRRLGQMTVRSSNPAPPLIIEALFEQFDKIDLDNPDPGLVKEQLYHFSLQVSEAIFNLFDLVLGDIGKEVSIRLPELPVDASNVVKLPKPVQAADSSKQKNPA